jgi:glycosyltransferase involved in cell wall biosynthesis
LNDRRTIFVIIPCYNEAGVIQETIAAVIEKGYSIIVVDDHSTDNTQRTA